MEEKRRRKRRGVFSEINVAPLVDVILVLLIIFMVTAPMMKHGLDVSLPQSETRSIDEQDIDRVLISIDKKGEVYINEAKIPMENFEMKLRQIYSDRLSKSIFLQADKEVPYGKVVEIMDLMKKSGIETLGMVTEPLERKGRR